jgi:acyl-CoA synthetase (AMP-forming)/AMP-acid ligase II
VHAQRLGCVDEPGVPGSLERLTYGELLDRAAGMVAALAQMGIDPGDRVAIVSPNAAKLLIALYGVIGSGRVLVPINFRLNADEVQFIVDDADAALLLIDPVLADRFAGVRAPWRIVLDGVTRMVSGGAPTPATVIERFQRATGWEMIHAYGLTETGPVLTANRVPPSEAATPDERAARLTAAGPPLLGVRLRVDADGQVLARTAKAMDGYWRAPEASDAAFPRRVASHRRWWGAARRRVADHRPQEGRDRDRRRNVSSLEVEGCLHQHPDVVDVAVIGIPHERWGERRRSSC